MQLLDLNTVDITKPYCHKVRYLLAESGTYWKELKTLSAYLTIYSLYFWSLTNMCSFNHFCKKVITLSVKIDGELSNCSLKFRSSSIKKSCSFICSAIKGYFFSRIKFSSVVK